MCVGGLEKFTYFAENDLPIHTDSRSMHWFMFGEITEFRVRSMYVKEPETIRWIDSFESNSVFFDIGANIGLYSIYAASQRNSKVYSFEPSFYNSYILSRNIEANNLQNLVVVAAIALSPKTDLTFMNISQSAGSGNNQISANGTSLIGGFTLDYILSSESINFPNYIKIDIDGLDFEVIKSAGNHLKDPQLKSVLIEVDESIPHHSNDVVDFMKTMNFSQVIKRHYPYFDKYHYTPIFNYIFYR